MNKKQAIDYLKKTEISIQSAHVALFFTDLVYLVYANRIYEINFWPVFCYISYKKAHLYFQLIPKRNIDALAKKMYTDFIKDPESLRKRIEEHRKLTKEFDVIWKQYLNGEDSLKTYKRLVEIARKWWYYGAIGEDKGEVIDLEIVPHFERRYGLSKAEAREIVYKLSHPEEQTAFNIERKMFLGICSDIVDNAELTKSLKIKDYGLILKNKKIFGKIQKYINEFFWIKTTFYSSKKITPVVLLEEVEREIKKHSRNEILEEIDKIEKNFSNIADEKQRLLKTMKLTKEDKRDIEFARLTIYWIDQRKIGMMKHIYYFSQLFMDIAKKLGIDYHELAVSKEDEVERLLRTGERLNRRVIEKRNEGIFSIYEKNSKCTDYYGKDAEDLFKLANRREHKEIRGVVASRTEINQIIGVVRIVKNPKKQDIKIGEILVTSMTRVEFVPLMRKAKAIITDEGGIACHAAIVSRELGIPCIIGTKVATDVLKNGDLVEIDIERGIVRKLK